MDVFREGYFKVGGREAVEIQRGLWDIGEPGVLFAPTTRGVAVIIDGVVRCHVPVDLWRQIGDAHVVSQ